MTWEEIAKAKKASVDDAIPSEWRLEKNPTANKVRNVGEYLDETLPARENSITSCTVTELAGKISRGELSAIEVTKAFCHRAALTHQLTTCCSEIFFERAYKKAEELDEYFKKNGKTVGPLHGVPISLKDQVNLEGIDSAIGYVSLVNKPKNKDEVSNIAKILENAGAVFYVKTTTPMAMMSGCTSSNIYGYTYNSYNRLLSSGGSSGGEGALIGARGSPLGFGTDIGGSIREPSCFHGLYGLRGCSNRLPYCNVTNSFAHAPVLASVIGPMAWDLDDLKLVTKLIIDSEPWMDDPKVPPIPWREVTDYPKKLCFAFVSDDGAARPHPPIERALQMCKDALVAQGHEVIDWEPPVSFIECRDLGASIYGADGYKEIADECAKSGEPIVREVMVLAGNGTDLPIGCSHVHEHWEQNKLRYEYQQKVDKYWKSTAQQTSTGRPVDAIITPLWETCSFKCEDIDMFSSAYSSTFNILDYAAVTTPVTTADKTLDSKDETYTPISDHDRAIHEYYDPELFHGTPVGLQVVTPRYEEERAIYLSGKLRDALSERR
ncbi:hypothetical protein CAAN1_19S00298 [[Candida] anglica]|uniref:amidase n=1 Tax=[Candida] anglica TaxID=148631 RepID=A0ABP0E723_9ASCO